MRWTVAEARRRFSDLLQRARAEPQEIYNRSRPVAAVVDVDTYRSFLEWRDRPQRRTIAEWVDELSRICEEEEFDMEVPRRSSRRNTFAEVLDELSGGHERAE